MTRPKDFAYIDAPLGPGFRSIEAGAGTGKTYSLIWVVVRLLLEKKKQAREILMVTFTDAACLEMRQRLREMLEAIEADGLDAHDAGELAKIRLAAGLTPADTKKLAERALDQLGRMAITTIHGFCQAAFAEHAVNAGFAPMAGAPVDGGVIADAIASDWVRSGRSIGAKHSAIAKAVRILMADPACDVSALQDGTALRSFVAERIAAEQTVTFDDLILRLRNALLPEKALAAAPPADLAEQKERALELTQQLRKAYSCCLIDEFQDTDSAQWDTFEHLFGTPEATQAGSLLLVVGDPKQAIYGFRGADLHTYLKAIRTSEGGQGSTLRRNFRSTPEMIAFFNAVFGHKGFFGGGEKLAITHPSAESPKGKLPDSAPPKKPVRLIPGNDPYSVANEVIRLLSTQPADKTIGVLVRNNSHGNMLHRALVEAAVPAALESTQSVYETQTAFQAFLLLRAALRPSDASARKSLLLSRPALFGNLPANIVDVSADQSDDRVLAIHNAVAEWLGKCHKAWVDKGFASCWETLTRTAPSKELTSVRETLARSAFRSRALIDLTHVGEHLGFTQADRRLDPDQLLTYLQLKVEQADVEDEGDAEAAPDECLRLESARPQVVVQTIHKSKGLEYDSVVLVCKTPKSAPTFPGNVLRTEGTRELTVGDKKKYLEKNRTLQAQTRDEDARLLYVAITRAKSRLTIFNDETVADPEKEYGFHKVLRNCGIDPATWATYDTLKAPDGSLPLRDLIETAAPDKTKPKQQATAEQPAEQPVPAPIGPTVLALDDRLDIAHLPETRGWSSFSGLTKNHAHKKAKEPEDRGEDEGEDDVPTSVTSPTADLLIRDDIKGADFGTVIHEILEVLDFTHGDHDLDGLAHDIEAKLIGQQVRLPAGESDWANISRELARSCQKWLDARLLVGPDQPGHRVRDLKRERCLHEVRFAMRGQCNARKLQQLAKAFAWEFGADSPLAKVKLGKIELDGILTGVIDLAYEQDGRFYILDWKTNHLGTNPADYDREGLVEGVAAHSYQIQFSLYAAALDLYLQQVYGDKWEYDQTKAQPGQYTFGGVQYIFLRAFGLKPEGHGCFYHLPKPEFIRELQVILTA
jgi:exodeoxyribonuclease V beta subunit